MAGDKKNLQQLNFLFIQIMKILSKTNIKFILFYGTLLGYIRNNEFIDGDDDIDVLMNRKDLPVLNKAINDNTNITVINHRDYLIQLFYNDIGPFDIFIYDDRPKDILIKWDAWALYYRTLIFPLKPIKFKGYNVFIPQNSHIILQQNYGKDYIIPQRKNIDYDRNKINTIRKSYMHIITFFQNLILIMIFYLLISYK